MPRRRARLDQIEPAAVDPIPELCPLCGRPLVPGPSVNAHHLVPRSRGGRHTVAMHRICHAKIHAVLSETEIARRYADPEALRAHPEIAAFIRWVANKPPEFFARTAKSATRRRR